MEERVVVLEERIAFIERDVEALSQVVREVADRLDAMQRELVRTRDTLAGRVDALTASMEGASGTGRAGDGGVVDDGGDADRPPHWGRVPGEQ